MRMMGEKNGNAKLKVSEVEEIRDSYPTLSQTELARIFNVCQKTISNIVNHKTW